MKKWQKEIENVLLDDEEEVLKKLEKTYKQSLKDVKKHAKELQNDLDKLIADDPDNENLIRSKVYQLNYQKALEKQINGYMDVIKRDNVKDINDYLKTVYSDGFMTQQYGLMKQGVSITMPINQKLLVKSITYKTEDIPLSTRIYKNVEKAKTTIISEISRGLSTGMSVNDISRNLENSMGVSSRKAYQLAQNEGARVRKDATIDCIKEAKKKGADLVKMWDATMDGKTRPIHAELHGKWAEVDEKFEYSGGEVFAPKEFGVPALDINCRCALLSVPRWDVDDNTRHYDNAWRENGNDKMYVDVKNYEEWKKLYYKNLDDNSSNNASSSSRTVVLDNDGLGDVFNSNTKNRKNAEIIVDYVNNQDVDDNIKNIYKDLDNGNITVKYGTNNAVNTFSDTITLRDLTKDSSQCWKDTNLHEMAHLKDHVKAPNGDMFSRQKRFMDVVDNTSASMSAEIKKVIDDAKNQYRTIETTLLNKLNTELSKINDDYENGKFLSYKEYDKMFKKAKRDYLDQRERELRSVGVSGLEDIYDALSGGEYRDNGTVKFGHGSAYYRNREKRISEILANYAQLSVSRPDLVDLLKKDKPDLVNMLDELIEELVK